MGRGDSGLDLSDVEWLVPVGYPCRNTQQVVEKEFVLKKRARAADMGLEVIALKVVVEARNVHEINQRE